MNKLCSTACGLAACGLALLHVAAAPVAQANWPFIRGNPDATGVAATSIGPDLTELWTFRAKDSAFESTAAIVDGVVYVGDVDGTFYALQLNDGSVIWQRTYADETITSGEKALWRRKGLDAGFINGVAVVDGRIYAPDYNGLLRCLDATSGDPIWTLNTDAELYAAPNVHNGRVLLVTERGELLSIDAADGEVKWTFAIDQPLRCWPTVAGGRALVAGCDARLYAVDLATGKAAEDIEISGPPDSMPAVRGGHVYFCTAGGLFHAVSLDPLTEAWTFRHPGQGEQLHGAAVTDDAVILGTHNKKVASLDLETGDEKWSFPVRSRVESSPVAAGSLAFFGTIRGRFYAVDAATGEEVFQYQAGGRFVASPAVSDGRLIIGNEDGTLYCFGTPQ